jgi:hydrogenase-4 component F
MGLAPLHNWLPDAHAEGPTPISAVLSGLLLNVALYALLRIKVIADGALHNGLPGKLLIGFGLLSVLVATFSLSRQKDVKRMFSYSSIEHIGLMTFAFGIGGPIATYAGLLHMTVHSLVKSAIFFSVGHACQKAGTQLMAEIRGLVKVSPPIAAGMLVGTFAILGMPPFGVFASEFLIVTTAMRELPWAAPLLLLALAVAFASIFWRVQAMVFGETTAKPLTHPPALLPIMLHLGLALMLGLYMPPYLDLWFRQAAQMIVG